MGLYLYELRLRFRLPADHEWDGATASMWTAVGMIAAFLPRYVIWLAFGPLLDRIVLPGVKDVNKF